MLHLKRVLVAALSFYLVAVGPVLANEFAETANPHAGAAKSSAAPGFELGRINLLKATGSAGLPGVAFADGFLWVTSAGYNHLGEANLLFKMTPTGEIVAIFEQASSSCWGWRGLTFDGQFLYAGDTEVIEQISIVDGQVTGVTIPSPFPNAGEGKPPRALAYDPATDHFWVANNDTDLYEIDRAGTIVNQFATAHAIFGLAWDADAPTGPTLWAWHQDSLWAASAIDPDTGLDKGDGFCGVYLPNAYGAGGADMSYELFPGKRVMLTIQQAAEFHLVMYEVGTDLSLTQTVNPPQATAGDSITIAWRVYNQGPEAATNIKVVTPVPVGFLQSSVHVSRGHALAKEDWTIPFLAPGASANLSRSGTLAGPDVLVAEIVEVDQYDQDSTPANGAPFEDDRAVNVVGTGVTDLALSLAQEAVCVATGETFVLNLTLRNQGFLADTPTIQTQVSAGLSIEAHATTTGTYNAADGSWQPGAMGPDQTAVLTLTLRAGAGDNRFHAAVTLAQLVDTVTDNNSVSITAAHPLSIIQQPAPVAGGLGQRVELRVAAGGDGPFTYDWRKDGLPLDGGYDPIFIIENLAASNQGDYQCTVTNPCGSVSSDTVNVELQMQEPADRHPDSTLIDTYTGDLPSGSAHFTHQGDTFLVISDYFDATTVLKWNGVDFQAIQQFDIAYASSVETFELGGRIFLAVTSKWDPDQNSYQTQSYLYEWSGQSFELFQTFETSGALGSAFLASGCGYWLAIANSAAPDGFHTDSTVYAWDGSSFQLSQSIPTHGAAGVTAFNHEGHSFLAFAEAGDFDGVAVASNIYQLNAGEFAPLTSAQTIGVRDWAWFTVNGEGMLITAESESAQIYRFDGAALTPVQAINKKHLTDWEPFLLNNSPMLAGGAEFPGKALVYFWNGSEFDKLPGRTYRSTTWRAFTIDGVRYLSETGLDGRTRVTTMTLDEAVASPDSRTTGGRR